MHDAAGAVEVADVRIQIAHGQCSVPAPATAELLRGVPLAASDVEGELTTPTGAAILTAVAERYGPLPSMTVQRIGYGAGRGILVSPREKQRFIDCLRQRCPAVVVTGF